MTDVVDSATRSRMMAGIRGKNTKPEMEIRSHLHGMGFRFRLHDKNLPGKPDLVLKKYKAVIFVHGCFWHLHGCHLFKWPATNAEFWKRKIRANQENDQLAVQSLLQAGWRVCIVWECSIKGPGKDIRKTIDSISFWLLKGGLKLEIAG